MKPLEIEKPANTRGFDKDRWCMRECTPTCDKLRLTRPEFPDPITDFPDVSWVYRISRIFTQTKQSSDALHECALLRANGRNPRILKKRKFQSWTSNSLSFPSKFNSLGFLGSRNPEGCTNYFEISENFICGLKQIPWNFQKNLYNSSPIIHINCLMKFRNS